MDVASDKPKLALTDQYNVMTKEELITKLIQYEAGNTN
jgi:hypothetical protein